MQTAAQIVDTIQPLKARYSTRHNASQDDKPEQPPLAVKVETDGLWQKWSLGMVRRGRENPASVLDIRGHNHRAQVDWLITRNLAPLMLLDPLTTLSPGQVVDLHRAHETGESLPEWLRLANPYGNECFTCGIDYTLETNGIQVRPEFDCPFPEGIPPYTTQVQIPSGCMVMDDDLREQFPIDEAIQTSLYLNYTSEIVRTSFEYEKMGLAHGFCGNSCPSIFRRSDGEFVIGTAGTGGRGSRRVGGIITDLWWYGIADREEYLRRGGEIERHTQEIPCRPGVYTVTHHGHSSRLDGHRELFAQIQWAGQIAPL